MAELSIAGSKISNMPLYVVSLNHFINDGSTFLVASLFPAMEIAFGFSILRIGLLVAVGYIINMVFQPLAGRLTQRYDAFLLLPAGISLIAASMFIFALSHTFLPMLISVVVLRFGSSFFHPVGAYVVSRCYSDERLDGAMGFESSFGNLGIVIAFISSAPLYLHFGWTGPFVIYAAFEIFTVLVTVASFRSNAIRQCGITMGQAVDEENETVRFSGKPGTVASERYTLGIPLFFIITSFIAGGSNAIFGNYGNLLLYHSGIGFGVSNDLMAMWFGSAFIGALVSGRLAARLTRMNALTLSYLIAGIGSVFLSVYSHNLAIASLSLLITGFTLSITYPATYSELSVFARNKLRNQGSSFGILYSSQIAGATFFGFLAGYVSSDFGLNISFNISAVILLLSVVAVLLRKAKISRSQQ